jgi:hypothetical protein
MTYQVIFCGIDGVVIASDKFEGQHRPDGTIARGNDVTKITIAGEFAWAFSGGERAKIFSMYLKKALSGKDGIADSDLLEIVESLRKPTHEDWQNAASGPDPTSKVILVRGSNRSIFRINPLIHMETDPEPTKKGRCVAGQISNTASFLFHRFHSLDMPVDALVRLAAYSVRTANCFDCSCIDGLDIAVYRNSTQKFEFIDSAVHWDVAERLEREICDLLKGQARLSAKEGES